MSRRKHNGCITWSGSIFIAAFISILIGIVTILCLVKLASLRVIWKEEKILAEMETGFNSFPSFSSALLLYDSHVEKDGDCLIRSPLAVINAKYSTNAQPTALFNYYDQKLQEQGWVLFDHTDWTANYGKEGGYSTHLEYLFEQGTYTLQMKWVGGRYPCE